ncbi:MAG: periplasmic heavy metal sensor [Candidatus Omnitrophica bacterium]|nr:periplasmic heavy metal sensor [Candidatus Omnitrophota bacterium]
MKNIKSIIIGLVVVFSMVSMVYAQTKGESRQHGDKQKGRVFKELNLTPEQEKKLEENRKAQGEEMTKLHMAIKEKQAKLQEELKNPLVTRATIEPLVNEIKFLQAELIDRRIGGIFAVKEILTPEQFSRFQQMTEKRQEDRKKHFKYRSTGSKGAD